MASTGSIPTGVGRDEIAGHAWSRSEGHTRADWDLTQSRQPVTDKPFGAASMTPRLVIRCWVFVVGPLWRHRLVSDPTKLRRVRTYAGLRTSTREREWWQREAGFGIS